MSHNRGFFLSSSVVSRMPGNQTALLSLGMGSMLVSYVWIEVGDSNDTQSRSRSVWGTRDVGWAPRRLGYRSRELGISKVDGKEDSQECASKHRDRCCARQMNRIRLAAPEHGPQY